ncbi:MAG TPA: PEGA domain-containing protein [Spirochaetia bacterium]|nr:PEGA domain-containing protein [Spirochaetia bacterium]
MKNMGLLFVSLSLIVIASCSTSKGTTFSKVAEADRVTDSEEEKLTDEERQFHAFALTIESDPSGAEVYINNTYAGITPLSTNDYPSGTFKIDLKKDGFYTKSKWIRYSGGTQSFIFDLEAITGKLLVIARPPGAEILLNGESLPPELSEVPVGTHNLTVRLFGYEYYNQTVLIEENITTTVEATLQEASFRLYAVDLSRRVFNPDNPGALGKTTLRFNVSTRGTGSVLILNGDGIEVNRYDLQDFHRWEQTASWNGRSADGVILRDGVYTIRIEAKGQNNGEIDIYDDYVRIDRTLTIAYRSLWSGNPGLLYVSTPEVLPQSSFQVSSILMGHLELNDGELLFRAPLDVSVRYGLGSNMEIDFQASIILEDVPFPPLAGSGSFHYLYLKSPIGFEGGLSAKITYHAYTGTDTYSNFTGLSLGAPSLFRMGPFAVVLCPELTLSPWRVTYSSSYDDEPNTYLWLYLRTGLFLDLGLFTAGLSVALRTSPLTEGFRIEVPFQSGLEAHLMIPNTQIFISLYIAAEIEAVDQWYLMGGGGFGFIY